MAKESVAMSRLQLGGESPIVIARAAERTLYAGLFGSLDSERLLELTDALTKSCERTRALYVIIDLSNVRAIDSAVADNLLSLGKAAQMMGVETVFCGIASALATTMVTSGVDFGRFDMVLDLESALERIYKSQGLQLVPT